MEKDGEHPDEVFESPPEEGQDWYFDLPQGAWERQEEKNRNLRQALLAKQQPASRREPEDEDTKPAQKKRRWFGGKDDDAAEATPEAEGTRFTRLSEESREERRARLEAMKSDQAAENWSTEPDAAAAPDRTLFSRNGEPREPMPEAEGEPVSRWDAIFGAGLEEGSIVEGMRQWATGAESEQTYDEDADVPAAEVMQEAATDDDESDEWDDLLADSEGGSILEALRNRRTHQPGEEPAGDDEASEPTAIDESAAEAAWLPAEPVEEQATSFETPTAENPEETMTPFAEAESSDELTVDDEEDIWATDDQEIAALLQGATPAMPDEVPEASTPEAEEPGGEWEPATAAFTAADEDVDADDAGATDEEPSNLLAWRAAKEQVAEMAAVPDEEVPEHRDEAVFEEALSAGSELDASASERVEPARKPGLLKRIFGLGGGDTSEPVAEEVPEVEGEGEWVPVEPAQLHAEMSEAGSEWASAVDETPEAVADAPLNMDDYDEPAWEDGGEWAPVEAEEPRTPRHLDTSWMAPMGSAARDAEAWSRPGEAPGQPEEPPPAAPSDSAGMEGDEEDPWAPFEPADAGHEHTEPGTAALATNDDDEGDAWEPVAFEDPATATSTDDADDVWAPELPAEPEQELPLEPATFEHSEIADDETEAPAATAMPGLSEDYTEDDWSGESATVEDDAPVDPMEEWGWDPETATALEATALPGIDEPVAEESPVASVKEPALNVPESEINLDASDAVAELAQMAEPDESAGEETFTVPWAEMSDDSDTAWDEPTTAAWDEPTTAAWDEPSEDEPDIVSAAMVEDEFVALDASDVVAELSDTEAVEPEPSPFIAPAMFDAEHDEDGEEEDWAEMLGGDEPATAATTAWSFASVSDTQEDAADPFDEEAEAHELESFPGGTMATMGMTGDDDRDEDAEPAAALPWQDAEPAETASQWSDEPAGEEDDALEASGSAWGQTESGESTENEGFDLAAYVPGDEDPTTPGDEPRVDAWGRPLDAPAGPVASESDDERDSAAREDDDAWAAVVAASGYDPEDEAEPPTFGKISSTERHDRAGSWLADNFPEDAPVPDPVEEAFAHEDASESDERDVVLRAFEAHAASDLDEEPKEASEPAKPEDFKELFGEDSKGIVEEFIEPHELPSFAKMRLSPQHQSGGGSWDDDDEWAAPEADDDGVAAAALERDALDAPFLAGSIKSSSAEDAKRTRTWVRELVETGLLALLVFLSVRASFQNFKVDGTSMSPTLADGQFLIVNKLVYSEVDVDKLSKVVPFVSAGDDPTRHVFHGPERGDIIVLRDPSSPDVDLIKRVVGLPGEKIEILGGVVYINDQRLIEPYIETRWSDDYPARVIPEDSYFVMGDNRDNSKDSRSPTIGFIAEELIIGRAEFSYLPFDAFGLIGNGGGSLSEEDGRPRLTSELRPPSYANQLVGD